MFPLSCGSLLLCWLPLVFFCFVISANALGWIMLERARFNRAALSCNMTLKCTGLGSGSLNQPCEAPTTADILKCVGCCLPQRRPLFFASLRALRNNRDKYSTESPHVTSLRGSRAHCVNAYTGSTGRCPMPAIDDWAGARSVCKFTHGKHFPLPGDPTLRSGGGRFSVQIHTPNALIVKWRVRACPLYDPAFSSLVCEKLGRKASIVKWRCF